MELTRVFPPEQYERALESWSFMDLTGKTPVFASLFGDVVFQGADGFWWLDTLEGTLSRPWGSADELRAALNTQEGQDQYLLGGLALAAHDRGLALDDGQVYTFEKPPVLGGGFDVENVTVMDFVVAVNLAGQIHEQIRGLPPGTPITGFTIGGA